jgi:hypothetical protein
MKTSKDNTAQAKRARKSPLIPLELRGNLIGKTGIHHIDRLAARIDALHASAKAGDVNAARKVAKESKAKTYKQVTDVVISAIERGDGYRISRELDDLLYSAFRWSREGVHAIKLYIARLRAERSKGGAE